MITLFRWATSSIALLTADDAFDEAAELERTEDAFDEDVFEEADAELAFDEAATELAGTEEAGTEETTELAGRECGTEETADETGTAAGAANTEADRAVRLFPKRNSSAAVNTSVSAPIPAKCSEARKKLRYFVRFLYGSSMTRGVSSA